LSVVEDVRIVDGTAVCGRLEVFAFDGWRTVCPNEFEDVDATISCIHMGFGYVCVRVAIRMMKLGAVISAKS